MSLDDGCIGFRVRIPLVNQPQGDLDTPPADPPRGARLAQHAVVVVGVAHLPDAREAVALHLADLVGRELEDDVPAVLRLQLRECARRADELPSSATDELDVVYSRAVRNACKGESVPWSHAGLFPRLHHVADLQPLRGEDVRQRLVR
eukprot:CAMPEP_0205897682 /NCGR_PEP_ID=MMETSP1083-20121108/25624_1 /ASSEMBLY_ACC=CAM_ASM_000430 /TAXON_ID=97485 /ORGANISM="Prymnesium parvum, Strain Texoma1" /LENGTH=147 /DNA_ID=CAMNT_0053262851 /DNA_START=425 /DNA_END=865 /DNA_ORIENTATION=-